MSALQGVVERPALAARPALACSDPRQPCSSRHRPQSLRAIALQSMDVSLDKEAFVEAAVDHQRAPALLEWLEESGAKQHSVTIQEVERQGNLLDCTVAARPLQAGDVALRIPEALVITLNRVFQDETVAELLTTNKLSELAVLCLYTCYEKKLGRQSVWYDFIKELDKFQARGQLGAKTPLLWDEGQVEELLAGSPIVQEIQARLKGIEREYESLDTVWYMSGSLFANYPYSVPSETFPLELFRQAFAAVQASVVHLQGVDLSRRFALVPLGPPLLSYSPTSKALLKYNASTQEVELIADRAYQPNEAIYAWCGPQPNRRLLLNYGIVDDDNPHDTVAMTATLPTSDPLFAAKRQVLQRHGLTTQQAFSCKRHQGMPEKLLPWLRLAHCTDAAEVQQLGGQAEWSSPGQPLSEANELTALCQLQLHLRDRLARYRTTVEEDDATVADESAGARQRVAARLLRIEKRILQELLRAVEALPLADKSLESDWRHGSAVIAVRLS